MIPDPIPVRLPNPNKILETLLVKSGYQSTASAGKTIPGEAENAVKRLFKHVTPESIYRISGLESYEKGGVQARGLCIRSRKISRLVSLLDSPEMICSFAVTLGPDIDELINRAMKRSITQSFFIDLAGSILTERLADQAEKHIHSLMAENNLEVTARFSPGYCDWKAGSGQEALFDFLDPGKIGIEKLPSGMMVPQKSVTAVIIAARKATIKTPCPGCLRSACDHRRS